MESQKVDLVKGETRMICPICNGKGCVYNALGSFYEDCGHCQGTGKVRVEGEPLTEQEYLQTCNTEQLVEAIYSLVWLNNKLFQRIEMDGHDRETDLKIVREWLKQPHKDGTK